MISAMPLMPMPPMPMKWIVPMSSGTRVWTRLHAALARFLDQIGEARRGIGLAERVRCGGALGEIARVRESCFQHVGEFFRRQFALRDAPARTGIRQHIGIGGLIVVHRMRSGNKDRGAADHRQLADGARAAARDHEMRLRHARGQIVEETARVRPSRRPSRRPRARIPDLRGGIAARCRDAREISGSIATAAGTSSLNARAPWLPPNTSRCSGPFVGRRIIWRARERDDFGAHRIAGEDDLAACPSARNARAERPPRSRAHGS